MDKIYVIKTADYPNGMAGSIHSSLIVKGLRKNGVKSALLIPYADMGKDAKNNRYVGHTNDVPYFYLNKQTIHSTNKLKAIVQIMSGMSNTALFVLRRFKNKKLNAVIIGTPDFFKFFPLILICYLYKIPIYLWAVEKMTLSNSNIGLFNKITYLGFYFSETVLPRISSGVIVISSFLYSYYRKYFNEDRILLSPILIDTKIKETYEIINIEINNIINKDYILYSGSFAAKDGLDYIFEAFSILSKKYPNFYFILTGKTFHNNNMRRIKELVNNLNINNKVIFTGLVSREELEILNYNAKILLVCRTNSDFANYGFPWKLGEYCLTGNPIIATKVGDIEKYFKDNSDMFLIDPESSKSIVTKMIYILENYKKAKEIAKKSKVKAIYYFNYLTETKKIKEFVSNTND